MPGARRSRRHRPARGQGVVEYGLIFGGSVAVMIVTLVVLGPLLAEFIGLVIRVIEEATGAR